MVTTISLNRFVQIFLDNVPRDRDDAPAFTLVLGAGASRSAGIPLTGEMIGVMEEAARLARIPLEAPPGGESLWSWRFRRVLEVLPWRDEFTDYPREFIMACIGRALREPNITHLVAAHLVQAGILGDIVTTNFDDQTLACFWSLPAESPYVEPHVIYDARTSGHRIAANVPVIIKAHGHHTTYGLGTVDSEVKALVSSVRNTLKNRPQPRCGYMVVGYSGSWEDGVMAVFRDRRLMRGKTLYWFFCGQEAPDTVLLRAVARSCNLCFIHNVDSDLFFLRLWHELHADEVRYGPPILEPYQFFNASRSWGRIRRQNPGIPWWEHVVNLPPISFGTRTTVKPLRNFPRLVNLRHRALPILKKINRLDENCLMGDCLPRLPTEFTRRASYSVSDCNRAIESELEELGRLIPVDLVWTRRNRKILELALGRRIDPFLTFILLQGLNHWTFGV